MVKFYSPYFLYYQLYFLCYLPITCVLPMSISYLISWPSVLSPSEGLLLQYWFFYLFFNFHLIYLISSLCDCSFIILRVFLFIFILIYKILYYSCLKSLKFFQGFLFNFFFCINLCNITFKSLIIFVSLKIFVGTSFSCSLKIFLSLIELQS